MKNKYSWCFPLPEDKIKEIWDEAILTVDSNVLLDLYRYHKTTREALIEAIKKFKGRLWLSHQAAEEFFRNRKKTIVSSVGSYDSAIKKIREMNEVVSGPLSDLKKNRVIPEEIFETLTTDIDSAIKKAENDVCSAKQMQPNFLLQDPILQELAELFDGYLGEPFSEDEMAEVIKEGQRRQDNKTPPGFLDSKKDGIKPLGDYFLWRHILNYAGNIKKPIIFVTSDAKEDWWERESGKTTGLHYELLKEMHSHSGMPFLAYTTDRFFSFSQKLGGQQSNQKAEEEITAYVRARNSNVNLVRVLSQAIETASESEHAGYITVELLRSAFAFTCSGPLVPNLEEIPNMQVSLHQAPEELPRHILRIGTGTKFDFNIHLKSTAYQELLPRGRYVFAYQATTEAMKQKIWPDR